MEETKKKIQEIKIYRRMFYDKHAGTYDKSWWESKEEARAEMDGFRRLVKIKSGEVILDVATGTGIFLIEMAKKGAICYGIDASPRMLEQLRRKVKEQGLENHVREIRVCEADRLPYSTNFFDWVTCVGMLEYYPIEYAEIVLTEIKRVLKSNKKCFIDIPDPGSKEAQAREYIYKHNLEAFEAITNKIGFRMLERNTAGWMIQCLLAS